MKNGSKINPKSIKHGPKIDQHLITIEQHRPKINYKSIKNQVQDMTRFGLISSILEASWVPSWRHVEAMLATKPFKRQHPKQNKKYFKKEAEREIGQGPGGP